MHRDAIVYIEEWYTKNQEYLDINDVADLGSYNINGTVKDIIPKVIGFDILKGEGVDVVIKPGIIPKQYRYKFGAVVTTSAFQCCPNPDIFKKQVLDLIKPEGLFILTMCPQSCEAGHSTSPNKYEYKDSIRMSLDELQKFWGEDFTNIEIYENDEDHPTLVLTAIKK
jgi:hypothetical protein